MLTDTKAKSKTAIRQYMQTKKIPLTAQDVKDKIYRQITVLEAEELLLELVDRRDKKVIKTQLADGTNVFCYKYTRKKKYYT